MQTSAYEYKCKRCGYVREELRGDTKYVTHGFDIARNRSNTAAHDTHFCPDHGHGIFDLIGITPPREEGE